MTAILAAELLDAAVASRCARLRLGGRRRHTERRAGEHLSGRGGQSIEFADFRDYHEGDDIRRVDWNSFARLRRPYLKVFRHEEEQHLAIIVDASASMAAGGKLQRACQLAAAFALVALTGGERVALHVAGAEERHLAGVRGRGAWPRVLATLDGVVAGGAARPAQAVERLLARHRGRGIALWLSDFLADEDPARAAGQLQAAGLELFAVQILSREELQPELSGDWRLADVEDGAVLDVSGAGQLLALYHEQLAALGARIQQVAAGRGGRATCVAADAPLEQQLADEFVRRGWLI